MLRPSSCQMMLCASLCRMCCQQYRLPVTTHAAAALLSLTTCTHYAVVAQQAPRHAWHQQPLRCLPAAEAVMRMQRPCVCYFVLLDPLRQTCCCWLPVAEHAWQRREQLNGVWAAPGAAWQRICTGCGACCRGCGSNDGHEGGGAAGGGGHPSATVGATAIRWRGGHPHHHNQGAV